MDRAVMNNANLKDAVLQRAIFTRSDLGGANIEGADFTNALLDKPQQMVRMRGCSALFDCIDGRKILLLFCALRAVCVTARLVFRCAAHGCADTGGQILVYHVRCQPTMSAHATARCRALCNYADGRNPVLCC